MNTRRLILGTLLTVWLSMCMACCCTIPCTSSARDKKPVAPQRQADPKKDQPQRQAEPDYRRVP